MRNLHNKAWIALLLLFLVMAALQFVPPWTLDYWQAWTFLAVYFAASAAITLYLMKKDPQLLARRMSGGPAAEKLPAQKIIMSLTIAGIYRPAGRSGAGSALRVVSPATLRCTRRRRPGRARLLRRFLRLPGK